MNDWADIHPGCAPGVDLDLLELERAERREQTATTGRGLRRLAASTAITIDAETTQWRQRLGRDQTSRAPKPTRPTSQPEARAGPEPPKPKLKPQTRYPQPKPQTRYPQPKPQTHQPRHRVPNPPRHLTPNLVSSSDALKSRSARQAKLLRQAEEAERIGRDDEQWNAWASGEPAREDDFDILDRRRPGRPSLGRSHRHAAGATPTNEMPIPVPPADTAPAGGLRSRVTAAIDRWADREAAVADRLESLLSPRSSAPNTTDEALRRRP